MAKATKTTNAASFAIGDRCAVATAATLQETAYGTVTDISKSGWFIVTLDEPERFSGCKGGKLSARLSSMAYESVEKAAKPAPSSFAGQLASANAPATAKEPKTKPPKAPKAAPKLPTECPECESGELESETNEDGSVTVSCSCGWEETIEAEADPDHASRMAEALRKARTRYEKTRRPEGSASADCADQIAKELRDYEPQDVANLADKVLQQPVGTHYAKYERLNNGQIRMNSGNRIRAYWKKINEDGNEAEIARVGLILNLIEA